MKITGLNIHLAKEWRTFLFIAIETDAGITGIGEAGLTGRELAVKGALEHFEPLIIGEDPFRIEHIWQKLFRGGFFPAGPIGSSAISAIDLALWDIKGKALETPVYQLLGGQCRDRLKTYCHLHGRGVDGITQSACQAVDEGWKSLRWEPHYEADGVIEPAASVTESLRQWEAVRRVVGDDIDLCFDVHTRLGLSDAIRLCKGVEAFRPFFMEDPLRSEAAGIYDRLREQVSVPLAAGEQFASKWQYKPLVENRLIDFARLDLCVGGGLTEARKIAGWCETNLIDIAVHNPIGPVSTAACAHFNLSLPNFGVMELPRRPEDCLSDVISTACHWQDGFVTLEDRPGLGIEIDFEGLARYPFEMVELPHIQRADGSFTNW